MPTLSGRRTSMKKAVTTTIIVAVLFPVFVAFIAGCNRNAPQQVEKIVIGAETVPHASPLWIAEHKGYFREEGLTVEIREFESGRTALRMMLTSRGHRYCYRGPDAGCFQQLQQE